MTAYPPIRGDEPCRRTDPDLFFPELGANDLSAAVNLCRQCPVLLPCLAYAVQHETHGIWAGTTPEQRREMRRLGRRRAA